MGFALSILVGPIFFALVQAGIEQGARAGIAVGAGIWISDLLFILCVYFGVSYVGQLVDWSGFSITLGVAGSIVLVLFGLATLLTRPPKFGKEQGIILKKSSYSKLCVKGFLVNTVNPFTFVFWISVMTTAVLQRDLSGQEASLFFGAILGMIMFTDTLKVLMAKKIRKRMKLQHFRIMRRISGGALILFGLVLFVRVLIEVGG